MFRNKALLLIQYFHSWCVRSQRPAPTPPLTGAGGSAESQHTDPKGGGSAESLHLIWVKHKTEGQVFDGIDSVKNLSL